MTYGSKPVFGAFDHGASVRGTFVHGAFVCTPTGIRFPVCIGLRNPTKSKRNVPTISRSFSLNVPIIIAIFVIDLQREVPACRHKGEPFEGPT